MPYSEDETRRFRPEDEAALRRAREEQRQAEQRYDEEARARRAAAYAQRQERQRQAEREQERRERQRRSEARRRQQAKTVQRQKKAEKDRQEQKNSLLQEAAEGTTLAGKLYLTQGQRVKALRWGLAALVVFVTVLFQDVVFSRITVFGCSLSFVPAVILLVCMMAPTEGACVFALCTALFWSFDGAPLGSVSILLLPAEAAVLGAWRQARLTRNLTSVLLCCLLGLTVHEELRFFVALFLGRAPWAFWYQGLVTAIFSFLACPVLYPVIQAIGRIGGTQWNE